MINKIISPNLNKYKLNIKYIFIENLSISLFMKNKILEKYNN